VEGNKFFLKIYSREGIIFQGYVLSVTSFNKVGEFDVLAKHANFISLIKDGVIIRDLQKNEKKFSFESALLRVKENIAEIYVGLEAVLKEANLPQEVYLGKKEVKE